MAVMARLACRIRQGRSRVGALQVGREARGHVGDDPLHEAEDRRQLRLRPRRVGAVGEGVDHGLRRGRSAPGGALPRGRLRAGSPRSRRGGPASAARSAAASTWARSARMAETSSSTPSSAIRPEPPCWRSSACRVSSPRRVRSRCRPRSGATARARSRKAGSRASNAAVAAWPSSPKAIFLISMGKTWWTSGGTRRERG